MELITLSSKVPAVNLLDWLAAQQSNDKVFLKLRDHNWSVAGFGNLFESPKAPLPFDNWVFEDFEEYLSLQTDPDIKFFVATPFYLKTSKFILPRFELVQDGTDYKLIVRRWSSESPNEFQGQVNLDISPVTETDFTVGEPKYSPDFETWTKTIQLAQGQLEKVVLARTTDISIESETSHLPYFLLNSLNSDSYKSLFQWDGETQWISVSPERLFRIEDSTLYTEALAGTRPRSQSKSDDDKLSQELLDSKKDRSEHEFVIQDIVEKLRGLSLNPDIRSTGIKKLTKVQHLHTEIDAELYGKIEVSALLRALHPTAALGGTPTDKALSFLQKHEPIQREYYGAPFGIMTRDFCEFFVNIRSARTTDARIRLFAGCGIVAESNPKEEWAELDSKTSQYMELLK